MARAALGVLMAGTSTRPGEPLDGWLRQALADGLGSVCLFAVNTPDLAGARQLTEQLRAVSPQLLIALDEEGGDVTRLQAATGSSLPGAAALGAAGDLGLTRRAGAGLGRLVAAAGVDLNLAPVLDVASEPDNPVIGVRSFGDRPGLVVEHGQAFVAGLAESGVAACAKHFPGHGDTLVDSHLGLPTVDADAQTVRARDVAPFWKVPTRAVMTAHLLVPALGEGPASLSSWATELLRRGNPEAVVVTDALGMAGASAATGIGEACVRALEAGADLLCLDSPLQRDPEATLAEAVTAIEAAVAAGRLDEQQLRRRAERVRRLSRPPAPPEPDLPGLVADLDRLGLEVARQAVTSSGEVRVAGPVTLVDLRTRADIAAGRMTRAYADAFARAQATTVSGAELAAGAPLPPGTTPVALVRLPRADTGEAEALRALLAARPETVVVHTGVAAGAPDVPRLVRALGNARPNALVTAELVLGPGDVPLPG